MKNGWKEIARLGVSDDGYPHVLVDAHGWSLRLGPRKTEQKYYSNVPSLLRALVEHSIRRQLRECPTLASAREMQAQVQAALERADAQGQRLLAAMQESSVRQFLPSEPGVPSSKSSNPEEAA